MKYLNLLKKYDRELDRIYSRLLKESKDNDSPGAEEVVDDEDDGGEEVEAESISDNKETAVEFDDLDESEGGKASEIFNKIKTLADDPDFEFQITDSEISDDGTLKIKGTYRRDFDRDDIRYKREPNLENIKREIDHEINEIMKQSGADCGCEIVLPSDQEVLDSWTDD